MGGPAFERARTDAVRASGVRRPRRDRRSVASPDATRSGRPLEGGDQALFGAVFHYDFSRVRVHSDDRAAASAAEARADAYTVGPDARPS